MYVAGKDLVGARAWVAAGHAHPALFSGAALAGAPHWVAGAPPAALAAGRPLRCEVQDRCAARRAAGPAAARLAVAAALPAPRHAPPLPSLPAVRGWRCQACPGL